MRWLAIHLPMLPLEAFSRGGDAGIPLAVSERRGRREQIGWCSPSAAAAGVMPGQRPNAARALMAELRVLERDPEGERAALEHLAAWSGQFTSQISLEPPQALLLELAGSRRLFGGLEPLLARIHAGPTELGFQAVLALAPTPGGALLLARAGRESRVQDRRALRSTLSSLPLSQLPLDSQRLAALQGMGLKTCGELLRLPRAGLGRRLGKGFLQQLDRILGQAPDPRPLFELPARFHRRLEFPAEVEETGALLFAARRLILEPAGFLMACQAGTQSLQWRLIHGECAPTLFQLGLLRPERDAGRLVDLLRTRLERIELAAPVREIELRVEDMRPLASGNMDLFAECDKREERDLQLLERLRARLGDQTVRGLCLMPEYRPEQAWRY